ncbi:hypothetical protein JVU11DRAFT_143 [Chiua virens]|nr:hypothetical protein JVU11DRAFT_143 [Chiua virens]
MFSGIASWWSSSESTPAKPSEKYDPTNPKMNPLNPQGLKPCCACPETKSARDACFLQQGVRRKPMFRANKEARGMYAWTWLPNLNYVVSIP